MITKLTVALKLIAIIVISTAIFTNTALAKTLIYPLAKDSTEKNPQKFYCTATKIEPSYPGNKIFMSNFVQMIKGFNQDGNKIITANELNKVYFLAYHDANLPQYANEAGYVTLTAGTFDFACFPGDGDRDLIRGSFG